MVPVRMGAFRALCVAGAGLALGSVAHAGGNVVFDATSNNGYFVPFTPTTPLGVVYSDSGWLGDGPGTGSGAFPFALEAITLRLASEGGSAGGQLSLIVKIHDGDPSGLVFGSGATLVTRAVTVAVAATKAGQPDFVDVTVPLSGVLTRGGFNNVGYSVQIASRSFDGSFGFQCSSATGQAAGFYTNNASFFNGSAWSLFAFGPDPVTGVANYAVTIFGTRRTTDCYANCDESTGPAQLTPADFTCFLAKFRAGDLYADCDGSAGTTPLSPADFVCFLGRYRAGCP
jgi:hypothetical protein